jgi:hypothetical protein
MRKHDRAALELAMREARKPPDARGEQLDRMLKGGRPWFEVARFAAGHCQCRALDLKPWELPPVWCGLSIGNGDPHGEALWARMKALGISRYDPDPVRSCERAEAGVLRL